MNKILSLLFAVSLAGCVSTGSEFDTSEINNLEKGVTTEADIYNKFGTPVTVSNDSSGQKILAYSYTDVDVDAATYIPIVGAFAGGATSNVKSLVITLNNGVVTDWNYTDSTARTN